MMRNSNAGTGKPASGNLGHSSDRVKAATQLSQSAMAVLQRYPPGTTQSFDSHLDPMGLNEDLSHTLHDKQQQTDSELAYMTSGMVWPAPPDLTSSEISPTGHETQDDMTTKVSQFSIDLAIE